MTTEGVDVLLVTTRLDSASDAVANALKRAGIRFYRLNTEDLPLGARSSCEFRSGAHRLRWHSADRAASFDAVKRVWFRRHRLPALPGDTVPAHAEYCLRESQWFVRGLLWSLAERVPAANWMSLPANVQRAESKILQLHVAERIGFVCPETLISNDPDQIRMFYAGQEGRVVAKPLRLGFFDYGDVQTAAYTTAVSTADLSSDDALAVAPVIYQRHLEKRCDIRVTIVGHSIYAAAIRSQDVDSAKVDWRRSDVELKHEVHALPDDIAGACQRLMKALNLHFGAIDLVLAPNDEYYFLEINPNGQWLWLEDKLKFPISNKIAEWLCSF